MSTIGNKFITKTTQQQLKKTRNKEITNDYEQLVCYYYGYPNTIDELNLLLLRHLAVVRL